MNDARHSPRVELHLHLEGAAPPGFIRRLSQEKHIDLSRIFNEDGSYAFRDFRHFLQVYEAACTVLQDPGDFHRLTLAVLEQSAAHGVRYTEAFLSPDFCGGSDLSAWRDYLHAIRDAAQIARTRHGIEMRGIITCIRHFGPQKARAAAHCAAETAGDFITGFGIAGDEGAGQPVDFAWSFDCAREAGLALTAHAGEWGGPQSVRAALRDLGVSRIGHGVRAIEDPALVAELADRGVVLEVCPGSNIALGLYSDVRAHPIAQLRAAGVRVTVSTDDPPFFHTDMTREYAALERSLGWGAEDFRALNRVAMEAAFCDAATRTRLLQELEA